MRYPIVNVPQRRQLGLAEGYEADVASFKNAVAKAQDEARARYNEAHKDEQVYHPPANPVQPPPAPPEEPDTREARDFSREGAIGPEANLPGTSGVISVVAGDEVPPPVPVPPQTPGGHAPVVTGIPDWNDRYYPPTLPPLPPETKPCPAGQARMYPEGPCQAYKPVASQDPSREGCYACGGTLKWGYGGGNCIPNGYDEHTCKASGGGLTLPTIPTGGTTTSSLINSPADSGFTQFAGGGLMSGRGLFGLGAPAYSRPIRIAGRRW